MTIIVTGGAGFLGHHLVERLLAQGKEVVVMDSLWTGSLENIRMFEGNPNFRHVVCDVRDPLPPVRNVEQIYHMACPASPDYFEVSPIEILDTCYQGTKNVLEYAVARGARVLVASTSEIYGEPQVDCQPETYWGNVNSFGPRSCYDEGKRSLEALAYGYRLAHNLDVRVARIFNAYGPFMAFDDGRAMPNFITAAMENRPITIYGDGSSTRCFQMAQDCVRGLNLLMESDHRGGPVNIGSDRETPIGEIAREIAAIVAAKMGRSTPVPIHFVQARQDDPTQRRPDITLAGEVLGWRPAIALEDGVSMTVDWFINKWRSKRTNGVNAHHHTVVSDYNNSMHGMTNQSRQAIAA